MSRDGYGIEHEHNLGSHAEWKLTSMSATGGGIPFLRITASSLGIGNPFALTGPFSVTNILWVDLLIVSFL